MSMTIETRVSVLVSTTLLGEQRAQACQALVAQGAFCWAPERRGASTLTLVRRQITDCDYFMLVLAGQYGELSASGVSHLHLDYLYAVSQKKPIAVLLLANPAGLPTELREADEYGRQRLQSFRQLLQRDQALVLTYASVESLTQQVHQAMLLLAERHPVQGWSRQVQPLSALQTPQVAGLQQRIIQLERQLEQAKAEQPMALPIDKPLPALERTSNGPAQEPDEQVVRTQPEDTLLLRYRVQAFQDGNFHQLNPSRQASWRDLLMALGPGFSPAAPEELFSRLMAEFLGDFALADARLELPRAHAVSRCQLDVQTLYNIKLQMRLNGWIVPVGRDPQQRLLWELTTAGEQELAQAMRNRMVL